MSDTTTIFAELAKLREAFEELKLAVKAATLGQTVEVSAQSPVKEESGWIDWNYDSAQKLRKGDRVVFSPHGLKVLKCAGWIHDEVEDDTVFRVDREDWKDWQQPLLFETVVGDYASCWPNVSTTGIQFLMVGGGYYD